MSLTPPFPVAPPSEPFRISSQIYLRHSLGGTNGRVTIIITAAIIAGLLLAALLTRDMRFLLVALMALFIAAPMVMGIVYYGIALSPEATRATLLHTVELRSDGSIKIVYLSDMGNDETAPGSIQSELINPEEIRTLSISERFFVYRLVSGRLLIVPKNVVILPPEAHCQFREFD